MQYSRRIVLLVIGALLGCAPSWALAAEIAIALTRSAPAHQQFSEAIRARASSLPHRLSDLGDVESGLDQTVLNRADAIIAVGARVAAEVLTQTSKPVLAVMLSHAQFSALRGAHPGKPLSAIVLDQPISRQLRLAAAILPAGGQLGVLVGPDNSALLPEIRIASRDTGVAVDVREVSSTDELLQKLDSLLKANAVLLTLPDSLLASQSSARTILLTSYRYRKPILAYSRAYVEAGALAAVYSAPEDVARDVADWVTDFNAKIALPPSSSPPRQFSIAVNRQVARALGLDVASDKALLDQVRGVSRP